MHQVSYFGSICLGYTCTEQNCGSLFELRCFTHALSDCWVLLLCWHAFKMFVCISNSFLFSVFIAFFVCISFCLAVLSIILRSHPRGETAAVSCSQLPLTLNQFSLRPFSQVIMVQWFSLGAHSTAEEPQAAPPLSMRVALLSLLSDCYLALLHQAQ